MMENTFDEYNDFYNPKKGSFKRTRLSPVFSCFCEHKQKELGSALSTTLFKDGKQEELICKQWVDDSFLAKIMAKALGIVITIINFVLRTIMIMLVVQIKEDTKTEQTRSIMMVIFIVQFFNTGILLLLVNANLSETRLWGLNKIFTGPYTDLNGDWYNDVGGIITYAMTFGAIFPLIEFAGFWSLRAFTRFMDRGF